MSNYIEKVEEKQSIEDITWDDIINSVDTEALEEEDVTALSYLLMGYSIPEAASKADMSASTLRRHLKENTIMQLALLEKKKLIVAFVFNQFQNRMIQALDISRDFLELDVTNTEFVISKAKTGIFNKQISHAQWVMETFMKMIDNNPLDKLNIQNTQGNVNILLNVENASPLDYLGSKLNNPSATPTCVGNPLLDMEGRPAYGVLGDWSYNQEGKIICHICGDEIGSKQAMSNHIKAHNIELPMYEDVFNVLWSDLR